MRQVLPRYLQALLRNESPFPSPLTQRLFTGQQTLDGRDIPMALGWFRGALGARHFSIMRAAVGLLLRASHLSPSAPRQRLAVQPHRHQNDRLLDHLDPPLLTAGSR